MEYKQKLLEIKNASDTTDLQKYAIDYLLEYTDGDNEYIEDHIIDIMNHGCVSGMVSPLVYYTDTKKFYNEYSDDIDEIIQELESQGIEPMKNAKAPYTNFMAWLGFEETIRALADKIGIEY